MGRLIVHKVGVVLLMTELFMTLGRHTGSREKHAGKGEGAMGSPREGVPVFAPVFASLKRRACQGGT